MSIPLSLGVTASFATAQVAPEAAGGQTLRPTRKHWSAKRRTQPLLVNCEEMWDRGTHMSRPGRARSI